MYEIPTPPSPLPPLDRYILCSGSRFLKAEGAYSHARTVSRMLNRSQQVYNPRTGVDALKVAPISQASAGALDLMKIAVLRYCFHCFML